MNAKESTSAPDVPPGKVTEAQIAAAKLALDAARRMGDLLQIDLAENSLNNLLDTYHTYHTSQRRKQ